MSEKQISYLNPDESELAVTALHTFGQPLSLEQAGEEARHRADSNRRMRAFTGELPLPLRQALQGIVLEDLVPVRDPVSQERGYIAPEGKTFEMRGRFRVYAQGMMPQGSIGEEELPYLSDDEFRKVYGDTLGTSVGEPVYFYGERKRVFRGKALVIVPSIDGSETIADNHDYDDDYQGPRLKVVGETRALPRSTVKVLYPQGFPGLSERIHYVVSDYAYGYVQQFGISDRQKVTIQLVDEKEDQDTLLSVTPPTWDDFSDRQTGLFLPPKHETEFDEDPPLGFDSHTRTDTSYFYGKWNEARGKAPRSLKQRIHDMRGMRNSGLPFADDLYTKELVRRYIVFSYVRDSMHDPEKMQESLSNAESAFHNDPRRPMTEGEKVGRVSLYIPQEQPLIQRRIIVNRNGRITPIDELYF